MSDFFDTPLSEFDTLEHHGIKGQKWGVRNAEWYPIDAYRKAKGIVVDAANSNTAKAIKSGTATAAKKTAEVTKKSAKAVEEAGADALTLINKQFLLLIMPQCLDWHLHQTGKTLRFLTLSYYP